MTISKSEIFPLTSGIEYFWCNQQGKPKCEFVLSVIHSKDLVSFRS